MVTLKIDGKTITVPEGTFITSAAAANGIDIPVFCGHPKMHPWAGCRICLVEVGLPRTIERDGQKITEIAKLPKLQAACAMPVSEGMEVYTDTPAAERNRRQVLEFLLLNHPLECPVCDKGGECPLQDITYKYGLSESRMVEPKRVLPDADVNEFVRLNYKRCIHCKRCVRFHEEVAGDHLMEFGRRGWETFIQPAPGIKSKFSGNQVEFCPVGALLSKPSRFKGRPWELEHTPSVCTGCAVGCNIEIHHRFGEVHRLWSRDNPEVDWGWLCDKGRFVYEQLYHPERISRPLIKNEAGEFVPASWGEAMKLVAENLKKTVELYGKESISGIAGSRLTNETYSIFRRLLASHIGTPNYHFGPFIPGVAKSPTKFLEEVLFRSEPWEKATASDVILAWGVDLLEEAPVLGLKVERDLQLGKCRLIAANSHATEGERFAEEVFHFPIRKQSDALKHLINGIADASAAPPELKRFVEILCGAKSVAILFGNEVLGAPNAAELISLIASLGRNLEIKLFGETDHADEGAITPAVSITPIFRDGNSIGAILFNHMSVIAMEHAGDEAGAAPGLDAILSGMSAGKSHFCYVIGADPVKNFPDTKLAKAAFERCGFVVVQDQFLTETAKCANVVLPALTALEQEGTVISSEKRLQKLNAPDVRFKLADSDFGILRKLFGEMGIPFRAATPEEAFKLISERFAFLAGMDYASIPATGSPLVFAHSADGSTPAGKNEFAKFGGVAPLAESAGGDNLLVLIPKVFHFNGENHSMHSEHFRVAVGEPFCEINPADAGRLGIADGSRAELASKAGGIELFVKVTQRVPAGHVLVSDSLPGVRLADILTLGEHTVVNLVPVGEAVAAGGG